MNDSDATQPYSASDGGAEPARYAPPPTAYAPPPVPYAPAPYASPPGYRLAASPGAEGHGLPATYAPQPGQIGQVRGTGFAMAMAIVTLGIYPLYWYYVTHEEMKRHSGTGLGGGLALLLAVFVGIAMPYITSSEVGGLYERRGQHQPVSGVTGLWYFPGFLLFFIGPIVWFVKTNAALNTYWRSVGAPG